MPRSSVCPRRPATLCRNLCSKPVGSSNKHGTWHAWASSPKILTGSGRNPGLCIFNSPPSPTLMMVDLRDTLRDTGPGLGFGHYVLPHVVPYHLMKGWRPANVGRTNDRRPVREVKAPSFWSAMCSRGDCPFLTPLLKVSFMPYVKRLKTT